MHYITEEKISCLDFTAVQSHPECGAICAFEGVVRNHHQGREVHKIIYEAYKPMAEKVLSQLKQEIEIEWPDCRVVVKHRFGELQIGEVAVAIVVWSPHRAEGFAACQALIDRIKQRVPIWKKEYYKDGSYEWVACHHQGGSQ